ncbi:MAG: hypothetical protein GXP26_10095 [Planctomycetes bacterium]|nr:hypothetical protein [Planctomycetota bacterium]
MIVHFRLVVCGLLLAFVLPGTLAMAGISTIAITGTDAPGILGGIFSSVVAGPVNGVGNLVFQATLENGFGGVASTDDDGIWLFDGTSATLVAREGNGNVPDVLGANFQAFSDLAIDATGNIVVRASLETGPGGVTSDSNQGAWRYSGGVGELAARTGAGNTPGVGGGDFSFIPLTLQVARNGLWVHNGTLALGVAGVTLTNDRGLWSYDSGGTDTLIAREETSSVPGVLSAEFDVFGPPSANTNGQTSFVGSLKLDVSITMANRVGIWQYTGASGTLIARTGVGGVPGAVGENYTTLDTLTQNSLGQIAMRATLNVVSDTGIWLYTSGVGTLLARSATGGVPNVAGANFDSFDTPLLNDAGQVLVRANLEIGPGGVTATSDSGLWLLDGAGSLVVRTGSGGVPGLPGANFLDLTTYSLNSQGQIALAATLETGIGGIGSSNDSGLWAIDPFGNSQLIAQEGDVLEGRTVATLDFLGGPGAGDSQASGWNNAGQLAFQAIFTNGDSGLFLFSPTSADFDADGDVDADDLAEWEPAFGMNNNADADGDGDSDGADFLIWQRQWGTGVPAIAAAVPEPNARVLLLLAGAMVCQFSRILRKK